MTRLGQYEQAEIELLAAVEGFKQLYGDEDGRTRRAVSRVADLYEAWDKPDQATEYRALLAERAPLS